MITSDPIDLLARSLDQVAGLLAAVRTDQESLPTPCRSWTVAQLGDHLIADLDRFLVTAQGGRPDWSADAPEVLTDRAAAFRDGAADLLAAWRQAGDLTGTITLPGLGEVPARFPVDQQVAEFAMHAWDLARATGQPVALDPEIGQASFDWVSATLKPQFRGDEADGKAFGPETPVAVDAPIYDRLAGVSGRDPAFMAS
ncbi:uncharacterized protein (TIGR03086 family) [Allocatelliglobosispora scoriae]|uniref:Uncharacterized protein (TIGR03086 family) n=1 Tax=Allocatelliglobosispora scoriae TaxID=643052 RepID=A0A841BIB3_9ACTN|nr:TIGR03086 family metal-binding protein [Allocatelliglobosispora scoriae]MBB5866803.1 uncharacterized protein (TIGR03086 family) [Allocatelliglobosispora scoriae]